MPGGAFSFNMGISYHAQLEIVMRRYTSHIHVYAYIHKFNYNSTSIISVLLAMLQPKSITVENFRRNFHGILLKLQTIPEN